MTEIEFAKQYQRLADKFNTDFQKRYDKETLSLFWSEINMLPASWFEFQVNMAVGDMKPITLSSLRDAAIKKRKEINEEQDMQALKNKYRGGGLEGVLKRMGVESLADAVKKKNRGAG